MASAFTLAGYHQALFGQSATPRILLEWGSCDDVRSETAQSRLFQQRDDDLASTGVLILTHNRGCWTPEVFEDVGRRREP